MEPKTTAGVEIGKTTPINNNTTSIEKPHWLGPHSGSIQLQDPTTYQKPTGYRGTSEQMQPRTDETGRDISASQTTEKVGTPQFYRAAGQKLARSDEADVRRTTGSPTIPGCNKLLLKHAPGTQPLDCNTVSYVKKELPQQHDERKTGSRSNTQAESAAAGRRIADRCQRPHPNRPPEQSTKKHVTQHAVSQPALGEARRQ